MNLKHGAFWWNYRVFEHRNSADKDAEIWHSVHEVYYEQEEGEVKRSFIASPASPRTKDECGRMIRAFEKPVVGWLDDASFKKNELGHDDYESYGWLAE